MDENEDAEGTTELFTTDLGGPDARVGYSPARRRGAPSAALVAVLVAGLVVAAGIGVLAAGRLRAANAAKHGQGPVVTDPDPARWPTRGDLAQEHRLVEQARARLASQGEVVSLPFAGRVGDVDVVVGVLRVPPDSERGQTEPFTKVFALSGVSGAPVAKWSVSSGWVPDRPRLSVTVPLPGGATGLVVLVRSSEESAAFSARPGYSGDGTVHRSFTAVPMDNGVGVARFPSPLEGAVAVRTVLGDRVVVDPPDVGPRLDGDGYVWADVPGTAGALADPSCRGFRGHDYLPPALGEVMRLLGADPSQATVAGIWCRENRVYHESRAVLGLDVRGSGAFQVTFSTSADYPSVLPVPAGRSRDYPQLLNDTILSGERTTVVSAPGGASVALLDAASGRTVATAGVDRVGYGRLRVSSDRGLRGDRVLVVRDAAGRERERVRATLGSTDAFGVHVDGPVS